MRTRQSPNTRQCARQARQGREFQGPRIRRRQEGTKVRSPQGRIALSPTLGRLQLASRTSCCSSEALDDLLKSLLDFGVAGRRMFIAPECWNAGPLLPLPEQGPESRALKAMLMLELEWRRWSERGACVGNSAPYTRCTALRPCAPLRASRPPQALRSSCLLTPCLCQP